MIEVKRYRKKPVEIEAMQLTQKNGEEAAEWCGGEAFDVGMAPGMCHHVNIETLEGVMRAVPGDWIIRGLAGEFYPCRADIFAASYDEVTV